MADRSQLNNFVSYMAAWFMLVILSNYTSSRRQLSSRHEQMLARIHSCDRCCFLQASGVPTKEKKYKFWKGWNLLFLQWL